MLCTLALAWFAVSPAVRTAEPPPDGYLYNNTAEGDGALQTFLEGGPSLVELYNTAIGFNTLNKDIDG